MTNDLNKPSRETLRRAKPVRGGKTSCAKCLEQRAPGSPYCHEHRREYDRAWHKRKYAYFKRLEAYAAQTGAIGEILEASS